MVLKLALSLATIIFFVCVSSPACTGSCVRKGSTYFLILKTVRFYPYFTNNEEDEVSEVKLLSQGKLFPLIQSIVYSSITLLYAVHLGFSALRKLPFFR